MSGEGQEMTSFLFMMGIISGVTGGSLVYVLLWLGHHIKWS